MASNAPPSTLASPPPPVPDTLLSFPAPHVLLVTLNRPKALNAIPRPQHFALERLWAWYDEEPSLRCAVLTGTGRAFCAGADLKEWNTINGGDDDSSSSNSSNSSNSSSSSSSNNNNNNNTPAPTDKPDGRMPRGGFGGMSNRGGKKPIIGAINGICFGGGMEMAINCDMLVASAGATFGLPEVTIGVIALAGALPRLVRTVGRQRAAEMALAGQPYAAERMRDWGLVNEVVADAAAVVPRALAWAARVAANSPDAVVVSREGLKLGWEGLGPEQATEWLTKGWYGRIEKGPNMVEGVKSFVERRKPVWTDSKL